MRLALPALLLLLLLVGCGTDGTPQPPGSSDTAAILVPLRFNPVVNGAPFHLDSLYTTTHGVPFRVSKLCWYLSRVELVDSTGTAAPVTLCDSAGHALPFGVHMVRADSAHSMAVYMRIYPGSYRGINFGIGVPGTTVSDTLNHSNASIHPYPLNVDADMYWGWKAGYVFFKIEGTSTVNDTALTFFYHIGDDARYVVRSLQTPFTVQRSAPRSVEVRMNLAQLFVSPTDNTASPNLGSASSSERLGMGGPLADNMTRNMRFNDVFSLVP